MNHLGEFYSKRYFSLEIAAAAVSSLSRENKIEIHLTDCQYCDALEFYAFKRLATIFCERSSRDR